MVQSNYDRVILTDAIRSTRRAIANILRASENDVLFDFEFDDDEKLEMITVYHTTDENTNAFFFYQLTNGFIETASSIQFVDASLTDLRTYVQIADVLQTAVTFAVPADNTQNERKLD